MEKPYCKGCDTYQQDDLIELSVMFGGTRLCKSCFQRFHHKVEEIDREMGDKREQRIKKAYKKLFIKPDYTIGWVITVFVFIGFLFWLLSLGYE